MPAIESIYRSREDFSAGIAEIYLAIAANAVGHIAKYRRSHAIPAASASTVGSGLTDMDIASADPFIAEQAKKALHFIHRADKESGLHEYTWLVKGFYDLVCTGDLKNAETVFRTAFERASKGTAAFKHFLFGASVGMV